MRILHLSAYDLLGGAAKAAFRLHRALGDAGADSLMLVRQKDSDRMDVIGPEGLFRRMAIKAQRRAERLLVIPRATGEFSVGSLPDGLVKRVHALRPDVVHVHWVSHGFLKLETLVELGVPIVWTMHDMWAFTGGCHYSGGCRRYETGCGECVMLARPSARDASWRGVRRRMEVTARSHIGFIAPSRWMAKCASGSTALAASDIRVIPNAVNTDIYYPRNRGEARAALGWSLTHLVILVGAMAVDSGERKGVRDFWKALTVLADQLPPDRMPRVVVFGTKRQRMLQMGQFTVIELGYVTDERRLADIYAAADMFVASSKEDNLPNTVMEALAAGVPVVGSRVGGIPDMVEHEVNGLLVEAGDHIGLSNAMYRLLTDDGLRVACAKAAREKALGSYAPSVVAGAHLALYRQIREGR